MGKWTPFPFVGGAYTDSALPWAHQDTVNYLPVLAERSGTRGPDKLAKPPGARVFATVGTGPHRGARDVEGKAFVVSGTGLYQVAVTGTSTLLGTIPGTGPVSMTHNQITGGNQLVVGNGSSGYVYNTVTAVFAQITDEGFPGFRTVDYIGQVVVGVEPQRRFWFHSDFANALEYNTLDRYEAESSPDRLVGTVVSHNDVLVFGERTIEQWSNTPTETRSFQRNDGMTIERGCASEHTIRRLDNTVFFLADNMTVCKIEGGSTPVPVSTRAMERAFENADPAKAFAFTWEDGGHAVYYITVDGKTWGWDVTQREWHRRDSAGLDRWRFNTMFKWNGDWYAGDYTNGDMYKLDWSYALEGCEPMDCRRRTAYVHNSGNRVIVRGVRVEVDSGGAMSECPIPPPPLMLVAPDNQTSIRTSLTGDLNSFSTVETGASTSSETLVDVAGGKVFHWTQAGMRVSSDRAVTFSAATGLPSESPSAVLYTGTEYLAFTLISTLASPSATSTFVFRSAAACRSPVMRAGTILGIYGGRFLNVSVNTGASFAFYNASASINSFEGIQCVSDAGAYFVIAANDLSSNLLIGRSLTGLSGSWTFAAGPATAIAHGLASDGAGKLLMVLNTGAAWVSSDEAVTWTAAAAVPYAFAGTYPPPQRNKLKFHSGKFYFGASQGGGVNKVYRFAIGDASWEEVYTGPMSASIDSIASLP